MVKFSFEGEMFNTLAEAKKAAFTSMLIGEVNFIYSVNIKKTYNPYAYNYRSIKRTAEGLHCSKANTCYISMNEGGNFNS